MINFHCLDIKLVSNWTAMANETRLQDHCREMDQKLEQTDSGVNKLQNSIMRMEGMLAEVSTKLLQEGIQWRRCRGFHECQWREEFHWCPKVSYAFLTRLTEVEFPKFDGSDFKERMFFYKQFLDIDAIPMDQRIELISIHLKGKALQWHKTFIKKKRIEHGLDGIS